MRRPTRLLALSVGGLAAASSFIAATHRASPVTPVTVAAASTPSFHPAFPNDLPSVIREELTTTTTSTTVAPAPRKDSGQVLARKVTRVAVPVRVASTVNMAAVWRCIGHYESGNNPAENTGNGYYGEFQFLASTWVHVMAQMGLGYRSYPYAAAAPESTQLAAAEYLQRESGWGQWSTAPRCGV